MMFFRVDNRLVHGQVIEAWLPYTRAARLIVCSGHLAEDPLQQDIMLLAVPSRIKVDFLIPQDLFFFFRNEKKLRERVLILFPDCLEARLAYELGVTFKTLNIGNLHYLPGKKQICPHVALSEDDTACLDFFADHGVALDFRCVPNDTVQVEGW